MSDPLSKQSLTEWLERNYTKWRPKVWRTSPNEAFPSTSMGGSQSSADNRSKAEDSQSFKADEKSGLQEFELHLEDLQKRRIRKRILLATSAVLFLAALGWGLVCYFNSQAQGKCCGDTAQRASPDSITNQPEDGARQSCRCEVTCTAALCPCCESKVGGPSSHPTLKGDQKVQGSLSDPVSEKTAGLKRRMEYITAEDSLADAERRHELNVGLRGITKCFGLWALLLAALVMVVLWRIIPRGKPHVIFASEVEEAQKRRALQQYAVVVEQIGREDTHQKNKEEDKDSKEKSTVVGVRPFYGIDFLNEVLCTESFRALFYDFVQRCLPEGKPNRRFLDHLADALLSDEGGFAEMSGILRPPAQTTQNAEVESPEVKSAKSRVCYLASRQVLHLLAEDPGLNYLLTWMAQRPGLLSLVP